MFRNTCLSFLSFFRVFFVFFLLLLFRKALQISCSLLCPPLAWPLINKGVISYASFLGLITNVQCFTKITQALLAVCATLKLAFSHLILFSASNLLICINSVCNSPWEYVWPSSWGSTTADSNQWVENIWRKKKVSLLNMYIFPSQYLLNNAVY